MKKSTSIYILSFVTLYSCTVYKSYNVTADKKIKRFKETQIKFKDKRISANYTYYLPKNVCMQNDTGELKKYADIVFKRNWSARYHKENNIKYLKMTSDTTGEFKYWGVKIRDGYFDLLYEKNKCKIIFRRGSEW